MLREEQIDIRRKRAAEGQFKIQNLGRNRVFSDYQVTNPTTGGQYRVSIREIYLQYGEQLQVGLHLPPRYSDMLRVLADTFFDLRGLWKGGDHYERLIEMVEQVPEQVTIFSDAMEFMEREIERREMLQRERQLCAELDEAEKEGRLPP